jgi:hypothetical protein
VAGAACVLTVQLPHAPGRRHGLRRHRTAVAQTLLRRGHFLSFAHLAFCAWEILLRAAALSFQPRRRRYFRRGASPFNASATFRNADNLSSRVLISRLRAARIAFNLFPPWKRDILSQLKSPL